MSTIQKLVAEIIGDGRLFDEASKPHAEAQATPPVQSPVSRREMYRGRELRAESPSRVAVYDGGHELYSTASDFESLDDAFTAARALVDVEHDGHVVTPSTGNETA